MNRSFKALEFNKIIDMLENLAITSGGKLLCENLSPSYDEKIITRNLDNTNLAETLIYKKSTPNFIRMKEILSILDRINLGASASFYELIQIKNLMENVKILKNYYQEEDENSLTYIFDNLVTIPKLVSKLRPIHEDFIDDDASNELFNIRKEILKSQENLRESLNSLISKYSTYLQDNIVTLKNDRYCLPVKNEFKNSIKGIVHASSSSGMTFFIEPISIIEKNNNIEELKSRETHEINRIIQEICSDIADNIDNIKNNYHVISELDFIFAKANLSINLRCSRAKINQKNKIYLKKARHPLIPREKVVPINIMLTENINQMIITGPNTGGKTVTLKTVGLLTLMTQSGLNIPCDEGSEITAYNNIYVDIGDEQSIEQNLSTFSSHMTNIIGILKNADENSLILLDELGAGTDPTEGEAIALSILNYLHSKNIMALATTHYSKIKYYAHTTHGVINASCEFDINTLSPTYKLMVGVAGKSNAFSIALRLGLSQKLIDSAKNSIENNSINIEEALIDIDQKKRYLNKVQESIRIKNLDIDKKLSNIKNLEQNLNDKKFSIIEKARCEATKIIEDAKSLADETIRDINKGKNHNDISKLEAGRTKLRKKLNELNSSTTLKKKTNDIKLDKSKIKIGDKVHIISYGCDGTVSTNIDSKGFLFVTDGLMKYKVKFEDLTFSKNKEESPTQASTYIPHRNQTISTEIKLLGFYGDDAIMELEKYIDDAVIAGLNSVRIVHGKGSGKLRKVIHEYLKKHPSVSSFELAEFGQGDAGVTIASLK